MDKVIENSFSFLTNKNSIVFVFVSLFTALYGGLAAPTLPNSITRLFEEDWFRVLILSLIALGASQDPKTAIMSSILFMMLINNL